MHENAWLNLGDIDKIVIASNPMIRRKKEDIEYPDVHLLRILKDPH